MIKNDLQTGMIVTTMSGSVYLVWKDRLLRRDGYLSLDNYAQDMTYHDRAYTQFDIAFVYGAEFPTGAPDAFDELLDPMGRSCLWNRFDEVKKNERRPMTLYDLEKELGYPIEIVEG